MAPTLALFLRALREHTRARGTYSVRAGICIGVAVLIWAAQEQSQWSGAPGRDFFDSLIHFDLLIICLAGLGLFPSVIAQEKEDGSMGLLRLADLSPASILLGKGGGALAAILFLLAVQVPFSLMAVTMGGISPTQIFRAYAFLAALLCGLSGVGLFFSTYCARVWHAVLAMLATVAFLALIPKIMQIISGWLNFLSEGDQLLPVIVNVNQIGGWFRDLSPSRCLSVIASTGYREVEIARSALVYGVIGLAGFLLAWAIFERRCGSELAYTDAGERTAVAALWRQWIGRPKAPSAFAWRAYHFQFGSYIFAGAIVVGGTMITIGSTALGSLFDPRITRQYAESMLLWVGWISFGLSALTVALNAWGVERWGRHLSALLITPNSLARLHWQKLCAGARVLLPSICFILLGDSLSGFSSLKLVVEPIGYGAAMRSICLADYFFLFCLTVNASLRLKWLAFPFALLVWVAANFGAFQLVLSLYRPLRRAGVQPTSTLQIAAACTVVVCVFVLRDVHRQLQHHAANEG